VVIDQASRRVNIRTMWGRAEDSRGYVQGPGYEEGQVFGLREVFDVP
jgi:hypothetical protein